MNRPRPRDLGRKPTYKVGSASAMSPPPSEDRRRLFRDAHESVGRGEGGRGARSFAPAERAFGADTFAEQEGALFSPHEMHRLVLAEVDRAQRQSYSLGCLRLGVDRIDSLQDIYGREAREEIERSLNGFLARDLRSSDFVGQLADGSLLCLLPQVTRDGLRGTAQRLLRGARKLAFESGRKRIHITLSIGVGFAEPGDHEALGRIHDSAEEAFERAARQGGDRTYELDLAREERLAEERLRASRAQAPPQPEARPEPAPAPARPAEAPRVEFDPSVLLATVRQALSEHASALADVRRERAAPVSEGSDSRQLDILERRVSKLATELERYQEQLLKLAGGQVDDQGVRSFGKLAGREAAMTQHKLEMMGEIFRANLALRDALAQSAPAAEEDRGPE